MLIMETFKHNDYSHNVDVICDMLTCLGSVQLTTGPSVFWSLQRPGCTVCSWTKKMVKGISGECNMTYLIGFTFENLSVVVVEQV